MKDFAKKFVYHEDFASPGTTRIRLSLFRQSIYLVSEKTVVGPSLSKDTRNSVAPGSPMSGSLSKIMEFYTCNLTRENHVSVLFSTRGADVGPASDSKARSSIPLIEKRTLTSVPLIEERTLTSVNLIEKRTLT